MFFSAVGFEQAPDHLPVTLTVSADGPARGIVDGATVAMSARAAISDLQVRIFSAAEGLEYESLRIVTMPFTEMQEAFEKGEIDAASVPDPFAAQIESSGVGRIIDRGTLSRKTPAIGRVMITGLVSTKRWIAEHHDLATRFAEVIGQVIAAAPPPRDGSAERSSRMHEPTFDTRLRVADLQLAFDLAAGYGVVADSVAAEVLIAPPGLEASRH